MKKQNKIKITQENGTIGIYRNGELEKLYFCDKIVENIKRGTMTDINLANMIAEIINDCLNCKTAVSTLKDLNKTDTYCGTYFENIDHFTD